jgi:hypothetical protein
MSLEYDLNSEELEFPLQSMFPIRLVVALW